VEEYGTPNLLNTLLMVDMRRSRDRCEMDKNSSRRVMERISTDQISSLNIEPYIRDTYIYFFKQIYVVLFGKQDALVELYSKLSIEISIVPLRRFLCFAKAMSHMSR
jgi:hypothetical protein